MKHIPTIAVISIIIVLLSCQAQTKKSEGGIDTKINLIAPSGKALAAFAEGCFWCSEHIFESVVGVDSAVSGYAGGNVPNPTYELVNTETTGHSESVLVYYNPGVISYSELLKVFFTSHDPTTPEQQGPDKGNSYRSIIFYKSAEEQSLAKQALLDFGKLFNDPIVTEIKPLTEFYKAEGYHQNYIEHNPESPYVTGVSIPRFELFRRNYQGKLKN